MTTEDITEEYSSKSPLLEAFLSEIVNQMKQQLKEQDIRLAFPFDCRVKHIEAVLAKVTKGNFTPKKSILEIQDLVGLRFVTLYKRDIARLEENINDLFPNSKRYDTKKKVSNDSFGYASTHYVITPPASWKEITHLKKFVGLQAEIQIRTLSQHIWAECSHSLHYKSTVNIPPNLERPLFRLSALMEIVDNELSNILHDHEEYKIMVSRLKLEDLLKEDLNGLTVGQLLSTIFKGHTALSENDYALIHKTLEDNYDILTLELLLYVINKHKPDMELLKGLNHTAIIEKILLKYKENNYS